MPSRRTILHHKGHEEHEEGAAKRLSGHRGSGLVTAILVVIFVSFVLPSRV